MLVVEHMFPCMTRINQSVYNLGCSGNKLVDKKTRLEGLRDGRYISVVLVQVR